MTRPGPGSSRFYGNTLALGASALVSAGLTLAQMKLLAASLTLSVFGLFASLRGLSLLVSMLAANGFPQVLVRFLPEHAARGRRAAAVRVSALAIVSTLAAAALMLALVFLRKATFFRQTPEPIGTPLLTWFALTTVAMALKLVLYGGFNGLRRFGSQTVLETAALAAQLAWMWVERDSLTLVRLFQITGVTSAVSALVALPWYGTRLSGDVPAREPGAGWGVYPQYWVGAVGLSVAALAFSDVDRWVLSNVLALEPLSLFHVASRIMRLTNRFIAIPVLAFQPEITRDSAEGRADSVAMSTRAFFKASVLLAMFACFAVGAYCHSLILLASNRAFLGARTTLWLLAASIPLSAMTAPLTAVMKALDAVRAALYCDLAWAVVYVTLLLVLVSPVGLAGTGMAQLAACACQLVIATRLASVRPTVGEMGQAFARSAACAAGAFAPVLVLDALRAPTLATVGAGVLALWLYVRIARRLGVLSPEERERVRVVLANKGFGPALAWFIP